jgi:hypothetical protein
LNVTTPPGPSCATSAAYFFFFSSSIILNRPSISISSSLYSLFTAAFTSSPIRRTMSMLSELV